MKIALIPARKGSKRLIDKNKLNFKGHPLIYFSIRYAIVNNFDKIVVSSDDTDIIELAKEMKVDFIKRPDTLSSDVTPIIDVLKHLTKLNSINDSSSITLLQPTNPLREKNTFEIAYEKFIKEECDSVISISKNSRKIGLVDDYFNPMYIPGNRSQDLNTYYENGQLYIFKPKNIIKNDLFGTNVSYVITDDYFGRVDIDDKYDLELAKIIFNDNEEKFKYLL
jgi:CMP-N-acetylneuraminic acid synthetase